MNFTQKYLSYLTVINEKKYHSTFNGTLEINWINGKKILDTENTNYSYGNLGKVLHKGLQHIVSDFKDESCEILILGLGGGDIIKQLRNVFKSNAKITAVEIDPVIIEIAMNEFGILPNNTLEIINNDAQLFLKYNQKQFNLIIVDLFFDATIPDFIFQKSFIDSLNTSLTNSGSILFNTFILEDLHELRNQKFIHLLEKHFKLQSFKKLFGHNHLIIAQKHP